MMADGSDLQIHGLVALNILKYVIWKMILNLYFTDINCHNMCLFNC